MNRVIFLAISVLLLSTALWAQTLPCVSAWYATDNTCNGQCGTVTVFQPVCSGYHCVQAHIVCSGGGNTTDCRFYVHLLNSTDSVHLLQWHNWGEEPYMCDGDHYGLPECNRFYLDKDKTYKMWTCLEGSCPGQTCDCTHCYAEIIVNMN